jgi:hypothetical protein
MPQRALAIGLFAVYAVVASGAERQSSQASSGTEALIRSATLVFVGTVVRPHASTMTEVPATESTAIVRVDDVIDEPRAAADLAGKNITVRLAQPGSATAGQQVTFFAKGWLLGDSVAVIEVGRAATATRPEQLREQVRATRQQMADEALGGEIASAEAIVAGTVAGVRPANIPHLGSEHDPDWHEADIAVEAVLKGSVPGKTITLLFPRSDDVMWHDAPKFATGQRGAWLLHRRQAKLRGVTDQYTALRPMDFQGPEQLDRIKRLITPVR